MFRAVKSSLIYYLWVLAMFIFPSLLIGQSCQVRVVDIDGMRMEEGKDSTYQIVGDYFDLTISASKPYSKFVKIEIREQLTSESLTDASSPLRTSKLKLWPKSVITTNIQVGQFALDKRYELRVIYLEGNTPLITRKVYFIRRNE